jgi:hypothetical protein
MLKKLGIGFAMLMVVLVAFSLYTENHPEAVHATATKLEPVDRVLTVCEDWTRKNSKLSVGEIEREYELTGRTLPADHHAVGIDYRSKGDGVLMHSRCEYVGDGSLLVKAESSLK